MKINDSRFDRLPVIDAESVGRPRLRLKNPVLADGGEVVDWTLYDFFSVALDTPFATAQTLFATPQGAQYTPVGGSAFNKTKLHTNLTGTGGQLPNGYKLDIQALRLVVDQAIQYQDLDNLLYNTYASLLIGAKDYFEGPYANLPGGVGAIVSAAPDVGYTGTPAVLIANGPMNSSGGNGLRGVYSFSAGLEASIAYGQNFNFTVDPTLSEAGIWSTATNAVEPPGVGIRAWQHLDGIWTRPTQ